MLDALKALQEMPCIDELDSISDAIVPTLSNTPDSFLTTKSTTSSISTNAPEESRPPTPPKQLPPRKCRLPMPSFVLDEDHATAIPANEKIANVRINRQFLTKEHRSQGSRLPMYKIILESPPPSPPIQTMSPTSKDLLSTCGKPLKKARSVRLSSPSVSRSSASSIPKADTTRKPYGRSQTLPLQQQQQQHKRSSPPSSLPRNADKKSSSAQSPPSLGKKKESSVTPETSPLSYRPKRLPESRTARLMMGISTTDRKALSTNTTTIAPQHLAPVKKKHQDITHQRPLSFSRPKSTTSTYAAASERPPAPSPSLTAGYARHSSALKISPPSPTKSRRPLSSSLPKKKSSVASSPSTTKDSIEKPDDSFKRIKVLQAY